MPLDAPARIAETALLRPQGWPAQVGALMTTRVGGVSRPPFDTLNLRLPGWRADAVDDPAAVHENHRLLHATLGARPIYLDQVHGRTVVRLEATDLQAADAAPHRADASVTAVPGLACTVLVADCLPVLLMAGNREAVGAAHAGWRGLAGGVLEATVALLCETARCGPQSLRAWLGACIGPAHFEVGADVREAFAGAADERFRPCADRPGKWWADLPGLARDRLAVIGVPDISGGHWCTHAEPARFYSYRRDGVTGRHAAAIWLQA